MKHRTLKDFERFAEKKNVQALFRREQLSEGGKYEEFVTQLYEDIDAAIYRLQASREFRQHDSEDRITKDILISLEQHGYFATHDSKTGGHVDLAVQLGSHSWIAEAKKNGGLNEGFLQLTTRYVQASGNFAHDHVGLLCYLVDVKDALRMLNGWRSKLSERGCACRECDKNRLAFYSQHTLPGSGTTVTLRTMVVSLYHEPEDRSARR